MRTKRIEGIVKNQEMSVRFGEFFTDIIVCYNVQIQVELYYDK